MKPIKFGDLEGFTQDSRKETLGKYLDKHSEKKAREKNKQKKDWYDGQKSGDGGSGKGSGRPKLSDKEKLGQYIRVRTSIAEKNMLQLMEDSEFSKKCMVGQGTLLRKSIHLFFGEFCKDPALLFDKLASLAMYEEKDDPEENRVMEEIIEDLKQEEKDDR